MEQGEIVTVPAENASDLITASVREGLAELSSMIEAGVLKTEESQRAKVAELETNYAKVSADLLETKQALAEMHRIRPEALDGGRQIKQWPLPEHQLKRKPRDENEREIQKLSDLAVLTYWLNHDPAGREVKQGADVQAMRMILDDFGIAEDSRIHKALDTYTTGSGLEWVPTIMSADFHQLIEASAVVKPLFKSVPMVSKNVTFPGGSGNVDVKLMTGSENSEVTEDASMVSLDVDFAAADIMARKDFSDNIDADAIIGIAEYTRGRLATGIARNLDLAILDGDESTPHMDGVAAGDPRKAWDGLRHKALADTGANKDLSTFTLDNLMGIPANMSPYIENLNDCVWIVSPNTFFSKLIPLKDSQNNAVFLSATNAGSTNPVVTGEIGKLAGIPVIVSGLLRTDLSQYGYYSSGYETNNTYLLLVRRDAWLLGTRQEITAKTQPEVKSAKTILVLHWRGDFNHMDGTGLSTALGYNIALG